MNNLNWGLLSAEVVSDSINFKRNDDNWAYRADDKSMEAKQVEGVAYLWNLLSKEGVALLADEVGTGKTFQALGVAAMLWKKKPNAKILVMAPNKNICLNWMCELNTFVQGHYRKADHLVKNSVDGGPVPAVQFCQRLDDLALAIERGAAHLYLTTINSLSGLNRTKAEDNADTEVSKASQAAKVAETIHDRIKSVIPEGFDLVIIDEAHYLRNKAGGSQRVAAASAFFGEKGPRLSSKNLLLTATPSHTRITDVSNVLSYFVSISTAYEASANDANLARELLSKYSLRRLRLLEGKSGYSSKHQYRNEKDKPSDFLTNPNAEMFFALYQKRLVLDMRKTAENKSLIYGYLEGFESVGREDEEGERAADGDDTDSRATDWSKAKDTDLLQELTRQYYTHFSQFPDHPKYGALVQQCVPSETLYDGADLEDHKHLIFVRRIPSVRELTQRINARYDDVLANMIIKAWGCDTNHEAVKKWRRESWSLDGFSTFYDAVSTAHDTEDIEPSDSDKIENENEKNYLSSRIAELFVIKKEKGGQADTALVRLRFTKPESLFSLFLEPSSDYKTAGYKKFYGDTGAGKPGYSSSALFQRQECWPDDIERKAHPLGEPKSEYESALKTVWSLAYDFLDDDQKAKLTDWAENKPTIAENFANYLKAGFLHASPVIIEIYCWYVEFRKQYQEVGRPNAQRAYREFLIMVGGIIESSLLLRYFKAALDSFDLLCGRVFDHAIDAWSDEWRSLKGLTSPAWYASGDVAADSRQRLILGFNSPFYPNVLVATSVFKEGVNLHMACHQVHHYGLAGSPGDNEQRVGRIDRLFGCVNKRLRRQDDAELSIYFPYLQGSVDEDQVASFIQRKYHIEDQMDACVQSEFDQSVDIVTGANWKNYLRKPKKEGFDSNLQPYPPKFVEIPPSEFYQPTYTYSPEVIVGHIESLFKAILDPFEDKLQRAEHSNIAERRLFLIDPSGNVNSDVRRPPIVVEKMFYPDLSALVEGTAYVVSMVSPITNKERLVEKGFDNSLKTIESFVQRRISQYPLVRVCINEKATNSHFYLSLRVDLPVFSRVGKTEMLSEREVLMAYGQLKKMAYDLEYLLFAGEQDLSSAEHGASLSDGFRQKRRECLLMRNAESGVSWENHEAINGRVSCLTADLGTEHIAAHHHLVGMGSPYHGDFHRLCQLNQKYPIINFACQLDGNRLLVAFPSEDFQHDERSLLEKWFSYVASLGKG